VEAFADERQQKSQRHKERNVAECISKTESSDMWISISLLQETPD
jgi:hypothetical protein